MYKHFSETIFNRSFSDEKIQQVWEKGTVVFNRDSSVWRKDSCGAWIKRSDYGNTNSDTGWEIDHIRPKSNGGNDHIDNLQPLQWENNRHKSDNYPRWSCKVSASA